MGRPPGIGGRADLSMKSTDTAALQQALGHRFSRPELLERALTHSSHAHEADSREAELLRDNEQLEFLGDAILGFVTSEALFEQFPGRHEGQLSKMRAHLVSARHLATIAASIQLGDYLRLGRGEERSGGRSKTALLSDALEAVLAAVYLDAGLDAARRIIREKIVRPELERIETEVEGEMAFTDYKSALQELLQSTGRPQPSYLVVNEQGPEHRKTFTIEVGIREKSGGAVYVGRAEGSTKKQAEQLAAREALQFLRSDKGQTVES